MKELLCTFDLRLFHGLPEGALQLGMDAGKVNISIFLQSVERDVTEHGVQITFAALSNLLNQKNKNNVAQEVNCNSVVREMEGLSKPTAPDSDEEEKVGIEQFNSKEKKLSALRVNKAIRRRHFLLLSHTLKSLTRFQRTLRLEKQRSSN